ncbi:MAG: DUF1320 domain-containing protein [Bacteroidales bacterium]|nr:DUF1320 domain-containing protein [Bacteroidales bacterium]MBQ8812014.1 DUF1320 domain-containing protein [Bacteroidales bacterium]
MATFINPEDYDASIHKEILDAVTRNDPQIIEICEDRAISEMKGYLSAKFDCEKIFSASGEARHQLVLMMAIDIAIYHLFCIHNPRNISEVRVDRYKRAIEWCKQVRSGEVNPPDLPLLEQEVRDAASEIQFRSNPKRNNFF